MALWIHSVLYGASLGLVASVAPGANTALCVSLGRSGARKALPVMVAAAGTDCVYSLLCSLGALQALHLHGGVLDWVSVLSLLAAAIVLWPRRGPLLGARAAAAVATLNPATAALWIAMSSTLVAHEHSVPISPVALALGTLIATGSWFLGLGYLASRLRAPSDALSRLERLSSFGLVGLALTCACLQLAL